MGRSWRCSSNTTSQLPISHPHFARFCVPSLFDFHSLTPPNCYCQHNKHHVLHVFARESCVLSRNLTALRCATIFKPRSAFKSILPQITGSPSTTPTTQPNIDANNHDNATRVPYQYHVDCHYPLAQQQHLRSQARELELDSYRAQASAARRPTFDATADPQDTPSARFAAVQLGDTPENMDSINGYNHQPLGEAQYASESSPSQPPTVKDPARHQRTYQGMRPTPISRFLCAEADVDKHVYHVAVVKCAAI